MCTARSIRMQNTTAYVQAMTGSKATLLAVGTQFLNFVKHSGYYGYSISMGEASCGPTQPSTQWVPWAVSPRVKRLGRVADHSPPSSAEIKNGGAVTCTRSYVFMA
jgi:hypothetical protein